MTTSTSLPRQPSGAEPRGGGPKRTRRLRALVLLLLALIVLAALLVLGLRAGLSALGIGSGAEDYAGEGSGEVVVQVLPGQTAADIATTLRDAGVVASRTAFLDVANSDERSRSLQPGSYRLKEEMSGASAFELLLDPAARLVARVTIPEGSRVTEIVTRIDEATDIPLADVEAAVADPAAIGLPEYADGNPEGFLFPATYDVEPGTTAVQLLSSMVDRFEQAAGEVDLEQRADELGMTAHEIVTVASLIEKEVRLAEERPQVARVVYNRLDRGMPLQFDSTVNYVLDDPRARLSLDDIAVDSPYNTYENRGLPPTPISNPGESALEAALSPADGDYVYFVTIDTDGRSLFTNDYQEFLRAKDKSQAEGVY